MIYSKITKFIDIFSEEYVSGEWITDKQNDGTPEHPIQMPYVAYNREVADFLKAVYCAELGNDTLEWLGAERILIADDFNNDLSYYLPGTTLYFYILGEPLHCLPKKKFSGNSIKEFR